MRSMRNEQQTQHSLSRNRQIDSVRAMACLLLVLFHVIGGDPGSGLLIPEGNPLRNLTEGFSNIRMPLFAFLAGVVYGMRPVTPQAIPGFVVGKMRRLLVPGFVAMTLFLILAKLIQTNLVLAHPVWIANLFLPFAHFWFLQAIFLLLLIIPALDAVTKGRFTPLFLVLAMALALSGFRLPVDVFSVNMAIYLAPYVLLGLWVVQLWPDPSLAAWQKLLAGVVCGALFATILVQSWPNPGVLDAPATSAIGYIIGASTCLLAYAALPVLPVIRRLGWYTFTIYLYHVLFTSLARRVLWAMEVEALPVHIVVGLVAGVIGPVLLHLACAKWVPTRRIVLGLKR